MRNLVRGSGATILRRFAAVVVVSGGVLVAPPSRAGLAGASGIVVTERPECRIRLTKVSYDDPAADDAEFLELRVETGAAPAAPAFGPTCSADPHAEAGRSSFDAAGPAVDGGPPTLGDCGLAALELVNGGAGACETYRTLPLADVAIPEDGYVVLCATDAALSGCDVTSAGRSALRNGWLQNGPADGLRFVDPGGAALLEVAYEGAPGCFSARTVALVDETGELGSAAPGTDDVNAFCDGKFVLLAGPDATLRSEARCKVAARPLGDAAGTLGPIDAADAAALAAPAPSVERAPGGPPRPAATSPGFDGGLFTITKVKSAHPPQPSCAFTRARQAGLSSLSSVLAGLGLLTRRTRRTCLPSRLALRAGSSARSGSARPR